MSIDNKRENIIKNQTPAFKLAGNVYISGEEYNKNHIFYQICIENYDLYHNDLLVTEVNLVDISSSNYEIVNKNYKEFHVNLKNLPDECYNNLSERDRYSKLVTLNKIDDLKVLSKGDEIMEESTNKIVSLSNDSEFISQLERQQIQEYARGVALEEAKLEAKEEGRYEGEKSEQIEIAKKSLEQHIDIETISLITGLSIEEINNLK